MKKDFTDFTSLVKLIPKVIISLNLDCCDTTSLSSVLPDQFEVTLGARDVRRKLIRSAAATWPVALWPGTAGVIQLIDLQ